MKKKTILIALIIAILAAGNAYADTLIIGIMPGQPYCEELNAEMPIDLQRHIWKLATDHNMSYEETNLYYAAMIGLAEAEGSFKATAYGTNTDGSVDRGMFQINSCNVSKMRRAGLISTYQDLYDPYKCADCADYIFYDCWIRGGYSEGTYGRYLYGGAHKNNKYTARVWAIMEKWRTTLYG